MASLEELSDVAEEEGSAVPEATGLFDNFVTSDSQIVFDYQVGFISFGSRPKVSIIGVCEVDQQALVAVPDLAWHRQKARRHMPDDALQKAVRVEARVGSGLDRTVPEDGTGIKIWLGFLKADLCGPRRLRLGRFAGRHPVPFRHGRVAYAASCRSFGGHLSRPLRVPQRRKRRSKTSVWHSRCRNTFGSAGRHHGRDFRKFEAVETGSGFLPSICSSWRPWSKKARSSAGLLRTALWIGSSCSAASANGWGLQKVF